MNSDANSELGHQRPSSDAELGRFDERLKELVGEESLRNFAHRSGVSASVLRQYLGGKSEPTRPALIAMARAGGVNVEWLATGKGPMRGGGAGEQSGADDASDFAYVPQYQVEASAGHGAVVENEPEVGRLAFRKDWLRQKGLQLGRLAAITIRGDSMAPTIRDGALVLVDTRDPRIQEDGVYVLQIDSHLVAKRLQRDLAGGLYIRSDNPAYQPQHLSGDQVTALRVVGRVIWAGAEL